MFSAGLHEILYVDVATELHYNKMRDLDFLGQNKREREAILSKQKHKIEIIRKSQSGFVEKLLQKISLGTNLNIKAYMYTCKCTYTMHG